MNIDQKQKRNIDLTDFDLIDVFEAMLAERKRILEDIDYLISQIAKNNPEEIARIQKAAEWYHYKLWSEARSKGTELEFEVKKPTEREPSDAEIELSLCIHFSNSMLDAIESSNLKEAFQAFSWLSEGVGKALGILNTQINLENEQTAFYKRAALKRHAENHAIKADALKYYVENISIFKSKDSAAEQIAGKIVPAKFRTVRDWITEYHKKQRPAGTP